jgi:hypothetical protein
MIELADGGGGVMEISPEGPAFSLCILLLFHLLAGLAPHF